VFLEEILPDHGRVPMTERTSLLNYQGVSVGQTVTGKVLTKVTESSLRTEWRCAQRCLEMHPEVERIQVYS
jgi:hypothetical protein